MFMPIIVCVMQWNARKCDEIDLLKSRKIVFGWIDRKVEIIRKVYREWLGNRGTNRNRLILKRTKTVGSAIEMVMLARITHYALETTYYKFRENLWETIIKLF